MHPLLADSLAAVQPLPWRTVEQRIGWRHGNPEMIPIPHNVVITIWLENCHSIDSVAMFALNGKYNKGQFASFRLKYKDPRCTILNYFATGRSIVVGAKTPNAAFYALHQLRKYLSDDRKNAGIKFVSPPQVSNIVLAAMFDYSLNIAAMHAANSSNTNYVPREFSGACYRPFPQAEREGCKANIFEEGAYTILGGTNMEIAVQIADKIAELVRPFKVGGWQRRDVVGEREAEFKLEKRKYSEQAELREARRQKLLQRVALHESELSEENY
jgi:TATA-box binding protein (TBP) (component of TFIID and TFIIIB)